MFLSNCVRERRMNCNGEDLNLLWCFHVLTCRCRRTWTCWRDTPLDARERKFRSVDLLQFPFELAHSCIFFLCWPYIHVYISSGVLTCYSFHSNSHIVVYFFLCWPYIHVYIYPLFDLVYISPLWFNIYISPLWFNIYIPFLI